MADRPPGPSTSTLLESLRGINFPANKGEILDQARQNGAPQAVISVLEYLPEKRYFARSDLLHSLGQHGE